MKALGFAVVTALAVALSGGWSPTGLSAVEAHGTATQARRTLSCTTEERALQLWAFATNPTIGSAGVTISTGDPNQPTSLLGVSSQQQHYGLGSRCHSVTKHVVLSRRRGACGRCPIADCLLRRHAACPHPPPDLVQRLGKAGERHARGRDAAEAKQEEQADRLRAVVAEAVRDVLLVGVHQSVRPM